MCLVTTGQSCLSFLHGQQRAWWGAGWSLVFPVGEATIALGCTLRSCQTNQPPLESNLEVFAGGLKSGLSLTGDSHSSWPVYQPEVWFGECQQVGICASVEWSSKTGEGAVGWWGLPKLELKRVVLEVRPWCLQVPCTYSSALIPWGSRTGLGLQRMNNQTGKPHLLCYKMNTLWRRGKKKKTRKRKRQDGYGGARFIQGKGASLSVPGLLLVSVRVFGFQLSPAPISQSLPPQENACCLPRHSSHTTGTAGRVFRLWHWWDTQHARSWWLVPTSPHLPPPILNGFIWFLGWRHRAERSRHFFLWFASKAL